MFFPVGVSTPTNETTTTFTVVEKSTAAEKPVPIIPAIRAVKRSFRLHDRSSISSVTSTSTVTSASSRRSSVSATSASSSQSTSRSGAISPDSVPAAPVMPKKVPVAPKPVVKGVQRPPPGAVLPPTGSGSTGGVLNKLRPAASQSVLKTGLSALTRRSSVSTLVSTSSIAPKAPGIQRPTTVAPKATTKPSGIATGLRPPTRVPATSAVSSRLSTGLPQPSSRRASVSTTTSRLAPPSSAGLTNGRSTTGRSAGAALRRVL